jgi:hypothetical protein
MIHRATAMSGSPRNPTTQGRSPPLPTACRRPRRDRAWCTCDPQPGTAVAGARQTQSSAHSGLTVSVPNLLRTRRGWRERGNRGSRDLPWSCRARFVGDAHVAGFVREQKPRCRARTTARVLLVSDRPDPTLGPALLRTGREPFNASGSSRPCWLLGAEVGGCGSGSRCG